MENAVVTYRLRKVRICLPAGIIWQDAASAPQDKSFPNLSGSTGLCDETRNPALKGAMERDPNAYHHRMDVSLAQALKCVADDARPKARRSDYRIIVWETLTYAGGPAKPVPTQEGGSPTGI